MRLLDTSVVKSQGLLGLVLATLFAAALSAGAPGQGTSRLCNPLVGDLRKGGEIEAHRESGAWVQAVGGPDAFGYTFIDSSEGGGPTFSWIDISATGTAVALGDDETAGPIPLGFTFPMYGAAFTSFHVSSNGWISFLSPSESDLGNDCPITALSEGAQPYRVALMHDDLDPSASSDLVRHQFFSDCPHPDFSGPCRVVSYQNYHHFPGDNGDVAGTFQAILFPSGDVLLQFLDAGGEEGAESTTGIIGGAPSGTATVGLTYVCSTPASLSDSLAVLFDAPAPSPRDVRLEMTSGKDPVLPAEPFEYVISVTNVGTEALTDVTVTDVFEEGVNYISDDCGGNLLGDEWTWTIGSLPVSAQAICRVTASLASCAVFENTATAMISETEFNALDNSATVTLNTSLDLLSDGGFEMGSPNPSWGEVSTNFGTPLCTLEDCGSGGGSAGPRSGDWWVWIGGAGQAAPETGSVSQVVTIPAASMAMLQFHLWIGASSATAADMFRVEMDGAPVFQVAAADTTYRSGYRAVFVDLAAFADGVPHTLTFTGSQANPENSNFSLDDISLLACPLPDVALALVAEPNPVAAGGDLVFQFTVTNGGLGPATNVTVTNTLPSGVVFVNADSSQGTFNTLGGTVTFSLGSLTPGGQATAEIEVSVNADAPSPIMSSAQVTLTETDANSTNNLANVSVELVDPEIEVTTTPLSAGVRDVDEPTEPLVRVTITNVGTGALVFVGPGISVTGTHAEDFPPTSIPPLTPIPASGVREIEIGFNPSGVGARSAQLVIRTSDSDEPMVAVPLAGTGIDQEIEVTPSPVDFGQADIDDSPPLSRAVDITNVGTNTLTFTGSQVSLESTGDFSITSDTGEGSLAPSESRTLQVVFDPDTLGVKAATIHVTSDDTDEATLLVSLMGIGEQFGPTGRSTRDIVDFILGRIAGDPVEFDVNEDTAVDAADVVEQIEFLANE